MGGALEYFDEGGGSTPRGRWNPEYNMVLNISSRKENKAGHAVFKCLNLNVNVKTVMNMNNND